MAFTFTSLALAKLKEFEAFLPHATWDRIGGVWDIGYGETDSKKYLFGPGTVWTEEKATEVLLDHLVAYETEVKGIVGSGIPENADSVALTQNQYSALVIFCYNIGVDAFEQSQLSSYLCAIPAGTSANGNYVAEQLRKWVRSRGVVVRGLQNRREAEIVLWNTPDSLSPSASPSTAIT